MQALRSIVFLISVCSSLFSYAQRDTLAIYRMGGIERIDGLSYGSSHEIVLFTDSTFCYTAAKAGQISISRGLVASGTWEYKGDTLCLDEKGMSTQRFEASTSGYRETRKNIQFWFFFAESIQSFNLPVVSIYSKDTMISIPLKMETKELSEKYQRLKYPVPYLGVELEVNLATVDSVSLFGITLTPKEKNHNELNFSCAPPFNVRLIEQGGSLRILGTAVPEEYRFYKIR